MENLCWLIPLMAWVVQVDQEVASSQTRAIKDYGGCHWYLLVLCKQHMKSRVFQVLISNSWFQNLNKKYVKGLNFIHDLSGTLRPSSFK